MNSQSLKGKITAEQVMLAVLLVTSTVFIVEPIVESYPDDARVFPQLTASVVFIGSLLILIQNYLPGPVQRFVAESVAITSTDDSDIPEEAESKIREEDEEQYKKDTLGAKYGYDVNETVFMVSTAILYFIAGWSAGFLFVTPLYILGYTLWFRISPIVSVFLAGMGTLVIYLFMTYLILPFDQGHIFDFSPFLPLVLDGLQLPIVGGGT